MFCCGESTHVVCDICLVHREQLPYVGETSVCVHGESDRLFSIVCTVLFNPLNLKRLRAEKSEGRKKGRRARF